MATKLTLSVDPQVIRTSKRWARLNGRSLSQTVEQFLAHLPPGPPATDDIPEGPLLRRWRGVLKDSPVAEQDYWEHQERKHL